MTAALCRRCDWTPTPDAGPEREQLRQHALDWAHPLCCACSRSLPATSPQTCETCIEQTQTDLAGILLLWAELPRHLGHAKAQAYDRDGRGGGDEHQLPGGTVLALLSPGSAGNAARKLTRTDVERGIEGREHGIDNQPDDTPSVAWTLASWEDDWRHTRGEPAACVPGGTSAVVLAATGYLERHTRWAGNNHGAFAEYATDLRELHARLEQANGRVRRPVKAGADCFSCAGPLVRPLNDEGLEIEVFEDGELVPLITCLNCQAEYPPSRYRLALRAKVEEGSRLTVAGEAYATPVVVAGIIGRAEQTVRNWLARGLLRREERNRVVYVNLADAVEQSDTRPRRVRDSA